MTMAPNDDTQPPTADCAACGLTVEATTPDDGATGVCPDCGGELLDTSDSGDANEATIDEPDSAEEYIGDDVRSVQASAGKEIVREVMFRAIEGGDGRTLEGYAAVFDSPADVVDQHGSYRETIKRGAFTKTINERKPVMMFDHGNHPMIGTMPIGQITMMREDEKGLFVRARLSDNWLVQPVVQAIADGAITGMSIRAGVVKDDWQPNLAEQIVERSVSELALRELGPVVFPAYEDTTVSMRSREIATALADPDTRAEVARAALGTDKSAARSTIEPGLAHSFDHVRRQALKALADL